MSKEKYPRERLEEWMQKKRMEEMDSEELRYRWSRREKWFFKSNMISAALIVILFIAGLFIGGLVVSQLDNYYYDDYQLVANALCLRTDNGNLVHTLTFTDGTIIVYCEEDYIGLVDDRSWEK